MKINITLEELNTIIQESITHGGDYGGPYYSDKESFEKSLSKICKRNHLIIVNDNYGCFEELKRDSKETDR